MDTKKLVSSCQKAMLKNEYKTSTIRGVRNLSRSDLETAILYAQHAQKYGSWEGTLKREPICICRWVLEKGDEESANNTVPE